MKEWDGEPYRRPAMAGSARIGAGLDWAVASEDESDGTGEPSFVPRGVVGDLLGWTQRELAVVSALELVHPDDREILDGRVVGGGPVVAYVPVEIRVMGRDSRYWWTRWHLTAVADGATCAVGGWVTRPDREVGPPVGVWQWDVDTDTVVWSPELLDMFGFRAAAPASFAQALEVVLPDDRPMVERRVAAAVATGERFVFTFRSAMGGRRDRWFHVVGRRCGGVGGCRLAGVVKDLNSATAPAPVRVIGSG